MSSLYTAMALNDGHGPSSFISAEDRVYDASSRFTPTLAANMNPAVAPDQNIHPAANQALQMMVSSAGT